MEGPPDAAYRLAVVASETAAGCYDWIIRGADGRCVARSPYACATEAAARLSGACWRREIGAGRSTAR